MDKAEWKELDLKELDLKFYGGLIAWEQVSRGCYEDKMRLSRNYARLKTLEMEMLKKCIVDIKKRAEENDETV